MSSRPREDVTLPLVIAPREGCPRKLKPGQVKRYLHAPKPLIGYMIACPSCGFIELHLNEKAGFVEVDVEGANVLRRTEKPVSCMLCLKIIRVFGDDIVGSFIEAKSATQPVQM